MSIRKYVKGELDKMKADTLQIIQPKQPELTEEQKKSNEVKVKRQDLQRIKQLLRAIENLENQIILAKRQVDGLAIEKGSATDKKEIDKMDNEMTSGNEYINQRKYELQGAIEELFFVFGNRKPQDVLDEIKERDKHYLAWFKENFKMEEK